MTLLQSLVIYFIQPVLSFIVIIIFAEVIFSWLISFNIVNLRNPVMAQIYTVVRNIAQPILAPIRKVIPAIGGLDLSPIVALLGIQWISGFLLPKLVGLG